MESFVKSYGFRMVVEDLKNTSRVLRGQQIEEARVESYVDGGFPFVFWWRSFLEESERTGGKFSTRTTPIYGITKGDEYHPVTSMAGNLAFVTSTMPGMTYPHALREVPFMKPTALNEFYDEFSLRTGVPTFQRRVLFIGTIARDLQFSIPYIMHRKASRAAVFEPFRLERKPMGTFKSFYRAFGNYPQADTIISGEISSSNDDDILQEASALGLSVTDAKAFIPDFEKLMAEIREEAGASNLTRDHVSRIEARIERSRANLESIHGARKGSMTET
jgi:hypothetical protein